MKQAGLIIILPLLAFSLLGSGLCAQDAVTEDYFQSKTAKKAQQDWTLNCQGCHKADGMGRPDKGLPMLTGEVSKFLQVEGGREYLSRVPGVTNASISDSDLTDLLNWLLLRFDPDNIPQKHMPYSVDEVSKWRKQPLAIDAAHYRKNLLAKLAAKNYKN